MADGTEVASKFLGLEGLWKFAANMGIAAMMTFLLSYLIVIQIPDVQEKFHVELRSERQLFREELKALRESDAKTGDKIAVAIENTKEMTFQTQKLFGENQRSMSENQKLMLRIIDKLEKSKIE